ncbi:hypothetical protein [uncultured Tenacibaculum sp.]|uniref:hypothetical protein n=1 Tax=uncultured Tenacibaculum sp. TaxID=174713 RepID=UPI0026398267|nr:hypothetical protein [uncultured Tenacibaculum sp.]
MKLLQLVNRTILALVVLLCFSFTSESNLFNESEKSKNINSNYRYIRITKINGETPYDFDPRCFENIFLFIRKIDEGAFVKGDQIWEVIIKQEQNTYRALGLGDDLEDDPNKPDPTICSEFRYQFIPPPNVSKDIIFGNNHISQE